MIALPLAILTTVPSRMLVAVWEDGAARPMSSGTKSRERRERVTSIGNAPKMDRDFMGERGCGRGSVKRSKRKSPARITGLPPRRGELRYGVPVVWLPDFRLQPHFFSTTSRANHSQANLFNSTPTDAPCKVNVTLF